MIRKNLFWTRDKLQRLQHETFHRELPDGASLHWVPLINKRKGHFRRASFVLAMRCLIACWRIRLQFKYFTTSPFSAIFFSLQMTSFNAQTLYLIHLTRNLAAVNRKGQIIYIRIAVITRDLLHTDGSLQQVYSCNIQQIRVTWF
jgi:hypothetical protein